jgi:hypothetical protein
MKILKQKQARSWVSTTFLGKRTHKTIKKNTLQNTKKKNRQEVGNPHNLRASKSRASEKKATGREGPLSHVRGPVVCCS